MWGLIGPFEARFTSFPPSVRGALRHIDDLRSGRHVQHRSHNPLGALMVYALWTTMAVVIASGVAMTGFPPKAHGEHAATTAARLSEADEADGTGARARPARRGEREGVAEEVHELAANLLLGLAVLHLAGVAFEVRRRGRQVVTAMIEER
ncbi:cytochrome b/b6 domain-containing protein [Caulobacter segnis]